MAFTWRSPKVGYFEMQSLSIEVKENRILRVMMLIGHCQARPGKVYSNEKNKIAAYAGIAMFIAFAALYLQHTPKTLAAMPQSRKLSVKSMA